MKLATNHPLILTLEVDPRDMQYFNGLRATHFPAHANYLPAHITLFHHLPNIPFVHEAIEAASHRDCFDITVLGPRLFANGVLFELVSPVLTGLHIQLQQPLEPYLKRQDRQLLRPHITIQNKVTQFKAQLLYEQLLPGFIPRNLKATGLKTWEYLRGPWRAYKEYAFKG
ncbi:phosphoesterase HXTX [Chitinophaga caeni]|uniref:Phosphoesterase HXTX n=1 Tax=Chitinophaga caeni TaxID=2029983 RepID=A0A291QZ41_9BACT|nr:2'-5' RNA ligase family protein [Chitinophaga caeni]ATL49205.1 phosphoesterase HXTX [Chitinophaga caeni]